MRFAEIFKTELFSKYGQKAGCYINEIYDEIIKEFILFADADAEEIGKAVIESFIESERYYNMG